MPGRRRWFVVELLRRLGPFLAIFGGIWTFAAAGFYLLQGGVSALTSFYWAIVTLTTIGYGDVLPTTTAAREFTIVIAASQLFLLGYLLTVITQVVGDERERRMLGTLGTDLRDHVVVLGYTAVGRAARRGLQIEHQKVGVVYEGEGEGAHNPARARAHPQLVPKRPP
ncbi:MAG: potassium channel family protein, partial [Candidatus Lutacidiplasmatales archaeon]